MKKSPHKFSFLLVSLGLILLFSLAIASLRPNIDAWRRNTVDKLVTQANSAQEPAVKLALLQQASMIGCRDPVAIEAMAKFWKDRGDLAKANKVYTNRISNPDYSYVATQYLKAQDYNSALAYAKKANAKDASAVGAVAEANANFNLGNVQAGCDMAVKATKLNLNNQSARSAVSNCKLLGGTITDQLIDLPVPTSEREQAYMLINNYVYSKGEEKLRGIKEKTAGDYLVLSKLLSARGETDNAIAQVEEGIALDVSNDALYKQAITLYTLKKNSQKINEYSSSHNQLEFNKYQ